MDIMESKSLLESLKTIPDWKSIQKSVLKFSPSLQTLILSIDMTTLTDRHHDTRVACRDFLYAQFEELPKAATYDLPLKIQCSEASRTSAAENADFWKNVSGFMLRPAV